MSIKFTTTYDDTKIYLKDIIGERDDINKKYSGINWWLESYLDLNQFKIYLKDKFKNRKKNFKISYYFPFFYTTINKKKYITKIHNKMVKEIKIRRKDDKKTINKVRKQIF